MKKAILSLFLLSLMVSPLTYVFADDDESEESSSSGKSKTVDIACVSAAVSTREDSIISAWGKFDDSITASLTARKAALVTAWTLTDASARKKAVRAAWETARKSRKEASKLYKGERRSAWNTFKSAVKKCGGSVGDDASKESDSTENVSI
jgi:hypothetical protein